MELNKKGSLTFYTIRTIGYDGGYESSNNVIRFELESDRDKFFEKLRKNNIDHLNEVDHSEYEYVSETEFNVDATDEDSGVWCYNFKCETEVIDFY